MDDVGDFMAHRESCPQLEPQIRSLYLELIGDCPRLYLGAGSSFEEEGRRGRVDRPAGWHLRSRRKLSSEMNLITSPLALAGEGQRRICTQR